MSGTNNRDMDVVSDCRELEPRREHDSRDEAQGSASVTRGQEPVGTGGDRATQETMPREDYKKIKLFACNYRCSERNAFTPNISTSYAIINILSIN